MLLYPEQYPKRIKEKKPYERYMVSSMFMEDNIARRLCEISEGNAMSLLRILLDRQN